VKFSVDRDLVEKARSGDLPSLEMLLKELQGSIFNLAVRMLGQKQDAQDASQEILIKVITHLGTWRAESAFTTWVWSIASRHLLNYRSRSPSRFEYSFEQLSEGLDAGLAYHNHVSAKLVSSELGPDEMLEARQTALACTQAMLMCLDPESRLAYVLDVIFGLDSVEASQVQGVSATTYRKRLSRARAEVHGFMEQKCGLVSEAAACRCNRQVEAKRAASAKGKLREGLHVSAQEADRASSGLKELLAMGDAAAAFRGAPEFDTSKALLDGIRSVVENSPFLRL
jgi:RNA polymerase sigma factor (sigma-70 family)